MPDQSSIENINLRSEEVQEILTRVPNWMIRWGSAVILGVLMLVVLASWVIKYPDVIATQIVITTNVPPEKIVAKTTGRIEAVLIANKTNVAKNTPIAIIENSANYQDVFRLSKAIDAAESNIENFPFSTFNTAQLGEIESSFAVFQKENSARLLNKNLKPFGVETAAQSYEAIQISERLSLLESQKTNNQSELALQKIDLERYEVLFKKGIVAAQELEKHKLAFLQSDRNYKSLLSTISQLKSTLNELNRNKKTTQINEKTTNTNLDRNYVQAFFALKKAVKDWELRYVLKSSIAGTVSFLQLWAVNQTVSAGDNVFVIIPFQKNGFVGKAKAVAQNSGKIAIGQSVNIRLSNYPDREFGIVKGVVKNISLTPDKDNNLLIDVALPQNFETTYHKKIVFQQEMSGTADVVTQDLRLIERVLYQFRSILER